jgi:radical SAM superfamily enzyme YgiQ (UPF0313 family)
MKISLLQLPIQGHDFFFSNENIPLAAAYLKAIAARQGIDVELVPRHVMSYGSDQAILRFLVDAHPDLVGMSCYQWNVERSLFLAQQLKRELPLCTIVLGGPEITPDNAFLLEHRGFDIGVVGEGEPVWEALLQSLPRIPKLPGLLLRNDHDQWHFTGVNTSHVSLKRLPSPFLSGSLDPHVEKILWLETVRGCLHRCSYCYYHKQSPKLRLFPQERIFTEVHRARDRGIEEIVFLDPCFAKRPRLGALLDRLAANTNDRGLGFHAECNSEDIDAVIAKKLSLASFTQLEVGLQSTKVSTLKRIHRRFHPQRFLEGVKYLQDGGIKVMVDVIAGLPGDTLDDVRRSLDWVLEHNAYDFLILYPLSLLPATELRQRCRELGLSAMPYPPYFVTRTQEMGAAEICQAFQYYEECMEEDICPPEMPSALDPKAEDFSLPGGLFNVIPWHTREQVKPLSYLWDRTAYALTIAFSAEVLKQPTLWVSGLRDYLEHNPFSLLSVEVPPDSFPEDLKPLWQLSEDHRHIMDRDYTVTHTPYRSFLILSRARDLIWKWPDPRESIPLKLHDGQKISYRPTCLVASPEKTSFKWLVDHLAKRYSTLPEIRVWDPPDDSD